MMSRKPQTASCARSSSRTSKTVLALLLAALVTVAWDAPVDGADGYLVRAWAPGSTTPTHTLDAGGALTATLDVPPGTSVVVFAYRRYNGGVVAISEPSTRVFATHTPDDPACAPPFGSETLALVITGLSPPGRPGSLMNVRFMLTSKSPVSAIVARVDGQDLATASGTAAGLLWFPTPPTGTHTVSVFTTNTFGCQREVLRPFVSP